MNRWLVGAIILVFGTAFAGAQSLDDLNIQIHGYATQGFLYTTRNNILTTNSSEGSPAWTEGVVNLNALPEPKLRIGAQGRYFLLGNYGNSITLDWAVGDYKVNDLLGIRVGKVKSPSGLFNETQDVDPVHLWALLPQSIYPIGSRTTYLALYGGLIYGTVKPFQPLGKIDYRIFGGLRAIPEGDGILLAPTEAGYTFPTGTQGALYGLNLRWHTPLPGFMLGVSDSLTDQHASITYTGTAIDPACANTCKASYIVPKFESQYIFFQYEHSKLMVAGEFYHIDASRKIQFPNGILAIDQTQKRRAWYGMATYKVTDKLSAGIYDSYQINPGIPLGPARYQKDWTLSGRYDFNPYLYAKAEEHFIDGTAVGYDNATNPGGLKPDTKLTIFKLGVNF
jgi:hypothetical protein